MSHHSLHIVMCACLTTMVIGGGCAGDGAPTSTVYRPAASHVRYTDVRAEDLIAPAPQDLVVQPGDVLEVRITDVVGPGVETVKRCRVGESGTISLPLIGPVRVAGLTEEQANQVVNDAMRVCR